MTESVMILSRSRCRMVGGYMGWIGYVPEDMRERKMDYETGQG